MSGKRGPKTMPSSIAKIKGTYRGDRHGDEVATGLQFIDSLIDPPEFFGEYAAKEWTSVLSAALNIYGWIAYSDLRALETHCVNLQMLMESIKELKDNGRVLQTKTGPKISPYFKIYLECVKVYQKTCAQFGLTPSDRTRIKLETKSDDKTDEFEYSTL